jgi:RNA polymerase sigma-70 factor (ECF subfamily)
VREEKEEADASRVQIDNEAEALARRAAARDRDAWALVFDRHWSAVYRFVRYRVGAPEQAEDLASQVFEVGFANAHRFDYQGLPIEAWLMGIARNLVRDHFKKAARRGIHDEFDDSVDVAEADPTELAGLRKDLAAALGDLTEDQRQVLELRFLLDRPVAETAMMMGRSEEAVKTLQRRALAAMQRALGGPGYAEGGGG